MHAPFLAFLSLLVAAFLTGLFVFYLLKASLSELLRRTIKEPAGVKFYLRSFLLILTLMPLAAALGIEFELKTDAHFMEYVWKWTGGLGTSIESAGLVLLVYLILITIIVAALKIKNDQ